MKFAFSTVACPEWTLARVASFAQDAGYQGVELPAFGSGSTQFTCDPALTDAEKIRLFALTSKRCPSHRSFRPVRRSISPPLIGHILGGTPKALWTPGGL